MKFIIYLIITLPNKIIGQDLMIHLNEPNKRSNDVRKFLYFLICKNFIFELKVPQNGIIVENLKNRVFYYYTM